MMNCRVAGFKMKIFWMQFRTGVMLDSKLVEELELGGGF